MEQSFDGLSYDDKAVKVSYYAGQGSFDGNKAGDYTTYYKAEPVSGKKSYLICRTISVREPETAVEESRESGNGQQETGEDVDDSKEDALVNKNWTRIFKFFTAIFLFSNNIFLLYTTFLLDLADSIRFSTIVKPAYALLAQRV